MTKTVTEEELIEELQKMRDDSIDYLIENHKDKMPNNTYRCGIEDGTVATCQYFIDFLKGGINEN